MIINLALASGKGSRLYPLSTDSKPKQFLPLISRNMMVEDTIDRFWPFANDAYIVTLKRYAKHLQNTYASVIYEDDRKESATSVYRAIKEIWNDRDYSLSGAVIVQTPSDHYIKNDNRFIEAVDEAIFYAQKGYMAMIGTKPSYPTSEYGYIKEGYSMVEKPIKETARVLINDGYYWNTAIYAYPLASMARCYHLFFDGEETSFEKAIVPLLTGHTKVIQADLEWYDIGRHSQLEVVRNKVNVPVVNEVNVPVTKPLWGEGGIHATKQWRAENRI